MQVPKIIEVSPKANLILSVKFSDGQIKILDIKPYLQTFEQFKSLLNPKIFNDVKVDSGGMGIIWNEKIDLSRYDIWEYGKSI